MERRRQLHISLTIVVTLLTAVGAGSVSVILAFGLTPTCKTTKPPGPPSLDAALAVTAVIAGALPVFVGGPSLGRWRWALAALAAAPPVAGLVITLTSPSSGFCF